MDWNILLLLCQFNIRNVGAKPELSELFGLSESTMGRYLKN